MRLSCVLDIVLVLLMILTLTLGVVVNVRAARLVRETESVLAGLGVEKEEPEAAGIIREYRELVRYGGI